MVDEPFSLPLGALEHFVAGVDHELAEVLHRREALTDALDQTRPAEHDFVQLQQFL